MCGTGGLGVLSVWYWGVGCTECVALGRWVYWVCGTGALGVLSVWHWGVGCTKCVALGGWVY